MKKLVVAAIIIEKFQIFSIFIVKISLSDKRAYNQIKSAIFK
jgi:hypothetical protein